MSDDAERASVEPERARLFVAVWPPHDVVERLEALDRPAEPGVRWTERDQWHVTLRFLGAAVVDDAVQALASVEHPTVEAVVGPQVSRLGRSVVCLPVAGLDGLAAAVVEATAEVGRPPEPRPFAGHLTLARLRQRAACGIAGTRFEATFAVDEVTLVRSRTDPDRARYEVLERRPLER